MEKIVVIREKKITIDKGKNDHGIWFDAGELEDVLNMGTLGKDNKVLNLLRDMFGKNSSSE